MFLFVKTVSDKIVRH